MATFVAAQGAAFVVGIAGSAFGLAAATRVVGTIPVAAVGSVVTIVIYSVGATRFNQRRSTTVRCTGTLIFTGVGVAHEVSTHRLRTAVYFASEAILITFTGGVATAVGTGRAVTAEIAFLATARFCTPY